MNKKILIGSIIAVAVLIGVSFTGVVGYQTTKSSAIAKASPLFTVRSKRAIGQGQKDITTEYLGHGEETNLHLSSRIKKTEQVQKAVDIISKMSDKAFSKVVARIILNLKNQEQMTDKETSDALQVLHYIRENPNVMKYYDTKNIPFPTLEYITCYGFPGCIIKFIYANLIFIMIAIAGWITSHTCFMVCNTLGCPL